MRMVALALAAWCGTAAAERSVGLAQAIAAAGGSPAHAAGEADREAAAHRVDAAGAWPATTLEVSTTRQTAQLDVLAVLPLPILGTLAADRAVARAELDVAAAELAAGDLQRAREAATAWFELARSEAHADAAQANAAREQALVASVQQRFAAGDASHADVVLAQAAAKRLAAQAAAARAGIATGSTALAAALGWDPADALHAGALPELPVAPTAGTHPELVAASRRTAADQARVTEASRARLPRFGVVLEAMLGDPTLPGADYRAGVSLELPLLGHGGAQVRAAEARAAASRAGEAATQTKLRGELAHASARFAQSAALATALAGDVLPAQREAADLARIAYREGQTGLVNLLEAERALAEAELEAIDARADAGLAYVELAWASGRAP